MVHNATTNEQWEYLKITSIAISIAFSEINIVNVNSSETLVENSGVNLISRYGSIRWSTNCTTDQAVHYRHQENTSRQDLKRDYSIQVIVFPKN
jgi:hypothetical protein